MSKTTSKAAQIARDYYNSPEADVFYFNVWGGEHIHVGIYQSPEDSIAGGSQRTVEHLCAKLSGLDAIAKCWT